MGGAVSLPGVDELTVGVLRSWARVALAELGRARAEIDELRSEEHTSELQSPI